jgi:hypothetical protein
MTGVLEALAISAATSLITAGLTYALTPTQKIESGRINDLTTAKSSYGASLPWCWGKVRVAGNLIWSTYLEEVTKKSKQGKGAKVQTEEYTYYGSFAVMLADCRFRPLSDIPRVWMNKKLTYSKVGGAETIAEGGKFAEQYLRFYLGTVNQNIDPLLQNTDPIQNYSYGLPQSKTERDAYLRSLGIDPNQTVYTPTYNGRAYMVAQRLPLGDFFNSLPTIEAEIVGSTNCTAGQIIGDIFGLFYPSNRFDVSLISTTDFSCEGFFVNSVEAAKNAVQNLQKAFFFDIVDSNGVFKFVPINHPRTAINLLAPDLAAHQSETQKPVDYEVIEADPTSLPSQVVVTYIDKDLNYDQNEQRSGGEVKNYYNPNPLTLNFSMVMSASQAATIADRSLFLGLLLSKIYKFQLPQAYLTLEPTDLIPNLFDGIGLLKLTQTRIGANLILDCEAVPHDLSFWSYKRNIESGSVTVGVASYTVAIATTGTVTAVSNATTGQVYTKGTDYTITANGSVQAVSGGAIASGTNLNISTSAPVKQSDTDLGTIVSAGNTELKVLDIPLIKDDDADYTLYLAAGGGVNWNGASIYISTDNSRYVYSTNFTTYSIFGTCISNLSGDTITVGVNKPELESVTDNDLALGFNLALVGNKIIQFKTAQLVDVNTYQLSGITNNLRGTETQASPIIGDRFILLTGENAVIARITGSAADIGQVRYFKAVSSGQTLDQVTPISLTIQGIAQRPYSPVQIAATKDGVGNITITWTRRDRHAALNTENPPLSEGQQEYLVQIVNSANNTVARVASSYINSYTYQSSFQVADFGSLRTTITVKIAQVSSDFGNGSFATATLTPIYSEPVPTITSFSPASAEVGTTITVTGTNLAQVSSVKINNLEQNNLAVIDNQTISFVLKEDTTSGSIKITTNGGIATSLNNLIVLETDLLIKNKTYNFVPSPNVISSFLSTFTNKILSNVTLNLAPGTYEENYIPLSGFRTIGQGLKIQGQGINNTIIKGRIDCIAMTTNIIIKNLTLEPLNTPELNPGITCSNQINLIVEQAKIKNFYTGIILGTKANASLDNISIEDCTKHGVYSTFHSVANVINSTITNCEIGIYARIFSSVDCKNSQLLNNQSGVIANHSSIIYIDSSSSSGNTAYGLESFVNSVIYASNMTTINNIAGDYNPPYSGQYGSTNGVIFF